MYSAALLSSSRTPSVVITPTETVTVQQNPLILVTSVMGVVIVIISVLAVTAVVILFIKWRQSVNSNKGMNKDAAAIFIADSTILLQKHTLKETIKHCSE